MLPTGSTLFQMLGQFSRNSDRLEEAKCQITAINYCISNQARIIEHPFELHTPITGVNKDSEEPVKIENYNTI